VVSRSAASPLHRAIAAITLAATLLWSAAATTGQTIRVAAASDLQLALPELARRFERETGIGVVPTFGSSGNLTSQIENGAPFDVLLSADIDYPRRLVQRGLAKHDAVVPYARGRLVLWTRRDSGVDLRTGLKGLEAPEIRRVAIANPDHAPYGRAAIAALRHEGVYDAMRDRLVLGESISQAAQFATSGNAQVAIIALSLAAGAPLREVGHYVEVPARAHPPIDQGAVWFNRSPNANAGRRFVEFLRQSDSVAYLNAMGFEPVPATR
jgi:molybdate transport system substrate-binding protein